MRRQQGRKNRAASPGKPKNRLRNPKIGPAFVDSGLDDHSRVGCSKDRRPACGDGLGRDAARLRGPPAAASRSTGALSDNRAVHAPSPRAGPTAFTTTANQRAEQPSPGGCTSTTTTDSTAASDATRLTNLPGEYTELRDNGPQHAWLGRRYATYGSSGLRAMVVPEEVLRHHRLAACSGQRPAPSLSPLIRIAPFTPCGKNPPRVTASPLR